MILYRSRSAALELLRAIVAETMAKKVQGFLRGLRAESLLLSSRSTCPSKECSEVALEQELRSAIEAASSVWFEIKVLKEARAMLKGLEREKEMLVEISTLVTVSFGFLSTCPCPSLFSFYSTIIARP